MSSIMDLLQQQLGGSNLQQLGRSIGADEKTTGAAVGAALPLLMGALSRNASKPEGAQALSAALNKDHDGSILDNLSGFLGQSDQGPGAGILKHVLGGQQSRVESSLSKATGMGGDSAGKLLQALAPMVMGALGRQQREQGFDANMLAGFLGEQRQQIEKQSPQMSMLTGFLDQDGDGDLDLSDVAKGFMGKLFGGR